MLTAMLVSAISYLATRGLLKLIYINEEGIKKILLIAGIVFIVLQIIIGMGGKLGLICFITLMVVDALLPMHQKEVAIIITVVLTIIVTKQIKAVQAHRLSNSDKSESQKSMIMWLG